MSGQTAVGSGRGRYVSLSAGQDSSLYKFLTRGRKCSSLAENLTVFSLNCSPSFLCTGLSPKSVPDFGYLADRIPVMLADGMSV